MIYAIWTIVALLILIVLQLGNVQYLLIDLIDAVKQQPRDAKGRFVKGIK